MTTFRTNSLVPLLRAASRLDQRGGGGGSGPWAFAAGAGVQAVLTAVLAVAAGTWVHGLAATTGSAPLGAVHVAFAALLAASVAGPFLADHAARVRSVVRWASAPVPGRLVLAACVLRESLRVPVGPSWAIAVGASAGLGPAAAALGALAATAIVLGVATIAHTVHAAVTARQLPWVRALVALGVSAFGLVLSLATSAAPTWEAALATLGSPSAGLSVFPSAWGVGALAGSGSAWVALACLPVAGGLAMVGSSALFERAATDVPRRRSALRAALPSGAAPLLSADLRLVWGDPAVRSAGLALLLPALLPALVIVGHVAHADGSEQGVDLARHAALVVHVAVVAASGVLLRVLGAGGGVAMVLRTAAGGTRVVASRAGAWVVVAGPSALLMGALVSVAAGAGAAGVAAAAAEGLAAVLAGAGVGILGSAFAGAYGVSGRGASGLLLGLGAGFATALAVLPIAALLHAGDGLWRPPTALVAGAALLALGVRAAGALVETRRESFHAGSARGAVGLG